MEESRNLEVVVISTQTIKPSSPCPSLNHQKTFKLSLLDQLTLQCYVPILLFYKGGGDEAADKLEERFTQHLKSSLSETLTRFYPLAGRFTDNLGTFICNNEGVAYSEARVLNSTLSGVLEKPNPKHLSLFLPEEDKESSSLDGNDSSTPYPLLIKVSLFGCGGGIVIGMKFHHKIADAATCTSFIKGWANSSLGGDMKSDLVIPDFSSASALFPPTDSLPPPPKVVPVQEWPGARASRFVFGLSELAALKAKATSPNLPPPTRVEAVSSLLCQAILLAKRESSSPKPSAVLWAVNLRSKLQPPLHDHCFGNLIALQTVVLQGGNIELPIMAGHLKQGTKDICNQYVEALKGGGGDTFGILELLMKSWKLLEKGLTGNIDLFFISSWCRFPLYEADFGWGKPVWVTTGGMIQTPQLMMLTDTRDGLGIEAWVCLMEEDMAVVESNQELHKFASFNPSVFH